MCNISAELSQVREELTQSSKKNMQQQSGHRARAQSALRTPREDIELLNNEPGGELGRGGFGTVYRAKLGGEPVAAKVVPLKGMQVQEMAQVFSEVQSEVAIMYRLRHPRIVQVMGCCEDTAAQSIIVLMALADGGSLRRRPTRRVEGI